MRGGQAGGRAGWRGGAVGSWAVGLTSASATQSSPWTALVGAPCSERRMHAAPTSGCSGCSWVAAGGAGGTQVAGGSGWPAAGRGAGTLTHHIALPVLHPHAAVSGAETKPHLSGDGGHRQRGGHGMGVQQRRWHRTRARQAGGQCGASVRHCWLGACGAAGLRPSTTHLGSGSRGCCRPSTTSCAPTHPPTTHPPIHPPTCCLLNRKGVAG